MRHGIIILPEKRWADARHTWIQAEELGFDHAWAYDHLSWRTLADAPWNATVPTLTAAALVTSSIRLGTFVSSPNFRHPVPFAKELATVDEMAKGRLSVGVGSGGTGFDAHVLGGPPLTPGQRHLRFEEFVRGLDKLLRFEDSDSSGISFTGDWFSANDARMVGQAEQRPRMPLIIAANGPKGMKLVAELGDGWATTGPEGVSPEQWWAGVAELRARLDDALDQSGRTAPLDRYLSVDASSQFALESVGAWDDAVGRAGELGFTDVVAHWPRAEGVYAGSEAVMAEVASRFSPAAHRVPNCADLPLLGGDTGNSAQFEAL